MKRLQRKITVNQLDLWGGQPFPTSSGWEASQLSRTREIGTLPCRCQGSGSQRRSARVHARTTDVTPQCANLFPI
jgi:hypothetical protein